MARCCSSSMLQQPVAGAIPAAQATQAYYDALPAGASGGPGTLLDSRAMVKRPEARSELSRLLALGDHRAAAARARSVLADPASAPAHRAEAEAALARLRPERGAAWTAAFGFLFFAAVAALGLLRS